MSDGKKAVESSKIWTTLITNTAYLSGLLTLDYSLKRVGSKYPLVALYTDTFPAEGHAALRARGIPAQRIEYLLPSSGGKDYSADPRFYDCWSKLMPFSLTQYDRIVQLDSDMLVRINMDELMDLPLDDPESLSSSLPLSPSPSSSSTTLSSSSSTPSSSSSSTPSTSSSSCSLGTRVFAAGHACVCNPLRKPHYPPDWIPSNCAFTSQHADPSAAQTSAADPSSAAGGPLGFMNGGLQVVNPSRAVFERIVAHMEADAARMDFADQSLLSSLFRGRWVALPYVYNALKTLRWEGVHAPIWRDDRVKNVHYILTPKPWDDLDPEEPGRSLSEDVTHHWWAEVHGERKALERRAGVNDRF